MKTCKTLKVFSVSSWQASAILYDPVQISPLSQVLDLLSRVIVSPP